MFFKINQKYLSRLKEFSKHNLITNRNSKSDYWLQQVNNIKLHLILLLFQYLASRGFTYPKKKNI